MNVTASRNLRNGIGRSISLRERSPIYPVSAAGTNGNRILTKDAPHPIHVLNG